MSYGTLDQVRALLPAFPITSTSNPSDTRVTEWLEENSGDLTGLVTTLSYPVPTSGAAFKKLANMNALYVAWKLGYAVKNLSGRAQGEANAVFDAFKTDYDQQWRNVRDGYSAYLFAPTEAKTPEIGVRFSAVGFPKCPLFRRDDEF